MPLPAIYKKNTILNSIKTTLTVLTRLIGLSAFLSISSIVHAEVEECYSTEFGLNYASDVSRYFNVSGAPLDMNEALTTTRLEQNDAYFKVLDQSDTILFDKLYDILVYSDGYILAKQNGQFGLIDDKGRLVYDFKYESIDRLNDGQALVSQYKKGQLTDGLIDDKGLRIYPKSESFEPNIRMTAVYYDANAQKGYFQINKDGKSGLIDGTGKIVIPAIYDEMEGLDHCVSGEFITKVRLDDQIGLINHNNKFVVPLRAKQSISAFSTVGYEPFILSIKNASQGVADTLYWSPNKANVISEQLIRPDGEVLITSNAPIKSLGGNLYQFSNNGKVGIVNDWAEIILGTYYDDIVFEYNSPLIVQRAGKFGILNTEQSGDTLKVRHYFDSLERVQNEEVIADFIRNIRNNESDDIVPDDENSNFIFEMNENFLVGQNDIEYVSSTSIENDYYNSRSPQAYIASNNGRHGVISSSEFVIIPFEYESIKEIGETFIVKQAGKYGVLDFEGNIIQPITFDAIQDSDNSFLILFKKDQQALMNDKGEIILPLSKIRLRFDMIGYAVAQIPIEQNGLFGYLNKAHNAIAIEPIYESVKLIYDNDNFIGQKNGKKRLINANNNVIKVEGTSNYHIIGSTTVNSEDGFIITSQGKQGIINTQAEIVLPIHYESIESVLLPQYDSQSDSYDYAKFFIVKQDGLFGLLDHNLVSVIPPTYPQLKSLKSHPYFVVAQSLSAANDPVKYGLIDTKGNLIKSIKYDDIFVDPDNSDYIIMKKGSEVEYYSEKIALGLDVVVVEDEF